jgi:trans-aconitate methyltransferase
MSPSLAIDQRSVLRHLQGDWNPVEQEYIEYHTPRFVYVMGLIGELLDAAGATAARPARVLDIGPHFITRLTHELFGDRVKIDTLGWPNFRLYEERIVDRHFQFDLNDAYDPERWPEFVEHDVVIMAEVIEHLYTAPRQVLACLLHFVKPGGYLIVQTPNAVALRSRLLMLAGKHPFDQINEDRTNPAHYREYTLEELCRFGEQAGFRVHRAVRQDYFRSNALGRLAGKLSPALRKGLTVVYQRPA